MRRAYTYVARDHMDVHTESTDPSPLSFGNCPKGTLLFKY